MNGPFYYLKNYAFIPVFFTIFVRGVACYHPGPIKII